MFLKQAENASSPPRQKVTNNTTTTKPRSLYITTDSLIRENYFLDNYVVNEAVRIVCANRNDVII